eukprot:gene33488-43274_t
MATSSNAARVLLHVGDEEGFISYEETVVYEMQKLWKAKDGMELSGVIDLCSRIEDLVYHDALKEYNIPESACVWNKRECIIYYQEKCEQILRSLEYKTLNWKKCFDDYEKNPRHLLNTILRDSELKGTKKPPHVSSGDPFKKIKSRVPKAPPTKKAPAAPKTATTKKKAVTTALPPPIPRVTTAMAAVMTSSSSLNTSIGGNKYYDLPIDPVIEGTAPEGIADLVMGDDVLDLIDFNMDEDPISADYAVDENKWKDN